MDWHKPFGWFRFAWSRAADLSLLQWLFPSTFSKVAVAVAWLLVAAIGALYRTPPVIWVTAAFVAAMALAATLALISHVKFKAKPSAPLAEATIPNLDWRPLLDGFDACCDPGLVYRRDSSWDTYRSFSERTDKLRDEMQEIMNAVPGCGWQGRPEALAKYNELQERMSRFSYMASLSESIYRDTWKELREDMEHRLESGELIAKGFIEPHGGGSGERLVSAAEWRILEVLPHQNAAQKRLGSDIAYSGLEVARATPLPLAILFDQHNGGKKFWSIEQVRDADGKLTADSYWEYRALVKNVSAKTIRNISVAVEAIGHMPSRPEPSYFDINKQPLIDLRPQAEALAVIRRWFNPPIFAGMVAGGAYGPIKMVASGDDVPPAVKLFRFAPDEVPMMAPLTPPFTVS